MESTFEFCEGDIRLEPFSTEEGAECVMRLASFGGGVPVDIASAKGLSAEVEGLPLGIRQLAALMRTQRTPLTKFLSLYRADKHRYHSGIPGRSGNIDEKRLDTNWLPTFNSLQELPNCRSLLGILSLLEHTDIPEKIFNHWDNSVSRVTDPLLDFCKLENE